MKKSLILAVFVFSLALVWCQKKTVPPLDLTTISISTIADLPALETIVTQVSEQLNNWTLSLYQSADFFQQLQQRYLELTPDSDVTIENTFASIQKTFDTKWFVIYSLPFWAKKLWMTEPQGMQIDKHLSTYTPMNESGYTAMLLVYKWTYTLAMQQAKIIAEKAHLYVSKNFQQAQALAKLGNIDYISGLDIGGLSKWIVYVNHELLDTNPDTILSVSVDQEGTLTIETDKYK